MAGQPLEQTRPYGARDAFARTVQFLVADNKNAMLEELNRPENVRAYLDAVTEGARRKDRTCIRMLHEIYDLAGMKQNMVMEFLARVGMATLEDAENKLQRVKDAQTMDAHQRAAACADYMGKYFDAHPERKGQILRRFGVEVPMSEGSYAVVQNADGP